MILARRRCGMTSLLAFSLLPALLSGCGRRDGRDSTKGAAAAPQGAPAQTEGRARRVMRSTDGRGRAGAGKMASPGRHYPGASDDGIATGLAGRLLQITDEYGVRVLQASSSDMSSAHQWVPMVELARQVSSVKGQALALATRTKLMKHVCIVQAAEALEDAIMQTALYMKEGGESSSVPGLGYMRERLEEATALANLITRVPRDLPSTAVLTGDDVAHYLDGGSYDSLSLRRQAVVDYVCSALSGQPAVTKERQKADSSRSTPAATAEPLREVPPNIILVGIIEGGSPMAVVREDRWSGKSAMLKVGDQYASNDGVWTVTRIGSHSLTMRSPSGRSHTYRLGSSG